MKNYDIKHSHFFLTLRTCASSALPSLSLRLLHVVLGTRAPVVPRHGRQPRTIACVMPRGLSSSTMTTFWAGVKPWQNALRRAAAANAAVIFPCLSTNPALPLTNFLLKDWIHASCTNEASPSCVIAVLWFSSKIEQVVTDNESGTFSRARLEILNFNNHTLFSIAS